MLCKLIGVFVRRDFLLILGFFLLPLALLRAADESPEMVEIRKLHSDYVKQINALADRAAFVLRRAAMTSNRATYMADREGFDAIMALKEEHDRGWNLFKTLEKNSENEAALQKEKHLHKEGKATACSILAPAGAWMIVFFSTLCLISDHERALMIASGTTVGSIVAGLLTYLGFIPYLNKAEREKILAEKNLEHFKELSAAYDQIQDEELKPEHLQHLIWKRFHDDWDIPIAEKDFPHWLRFIEGGMLMPAVRFLKYNSTKKAYEPNELAVDYLDHFPTVLDKAVNHLVDWYRNQHFTNLSQLGVKNLENILALLPSPHEQGRGAAKKYLDTLVRVNAFLEKCAVPLEKALPSWEELYQIEVPQNNFSLIWKDLTSKKFIAWIGLDGLKQHPVLSQAISKQMDLEEPFVISSKTSVNRSKQIVILELTFYPTDTVTLNYKREIKIPIPSDFPDEPTFEDLVVLPDFVSQVYRSLKINSPIIPVNPRASFADKVRGSEAETLQTVTTVATPAIEETEKRDCKNGNCQLTNIPATAKFCPRCGARVEKTETMSESAPTPEEEVEPTVATRLEIPPLPDLPSPRQIKKTYVLAPGESNPYAVPVTGPSMIATDDPNRQPQTYMISNLSPQGLQVVSGPFGNSDNKSQAEKDTWQISSQFLVGKFGTDQVGQLVGGKPQPSEQSELDRPNANLERLVKHCHGEKKTAADDEPQRSDTPSENPTPEATF